MSPRGGEEDAEAPSGPAGREQDVQSNRFTYGALLVGKLFSFTERAFGAGTKPGRFLTPVAAWVTAQGRAAHG